MRVSSLILVCALAGCTPGAPSAGSGTGGGGGGGGPTSTSTTINVSLTSSNVSSTPYGTAGGYAPSVTTVAVGSFVRFVNVDSFPHTATSMGATTFPSMSPFGSHSVEVEGNKLSEGWSAGSLAPGTASQMLLADKPGTYLYGCFFHYSAPMRGAVIVQ